VIEYFIRGILRGSITLFLISIVGFIIINLPAGDFVDDLEARLSAGGSALSRDQVGKIRENYGLDRPYYQQYFYWLSGLVRGDLGISFQYNVPVSKLIGGERVLLTLIVCGATLAFVWILGVPIGVYSATHKYSFGDNLATFFAFVGLSIPNFLLALTILIIGVFYLGWGHVGGLFSPEYAQAPWSWGRFVDMLKYLWMPVIVVGTAELATVVRIMRGNLLDVINQPYIQTARAKGIHERLVIYKHAVRVAINPLISLMGMQFPRLISGVIITAIVLDLNVIGPVFYKALQTQDMYVAGAVLMLIGVLLVIGNFLADLALAWVDPRIRYG